MNHFLYETEYQESGLGEKRMCLRCAYLLSGFKPVSLYSYDLLILLAVKKILYFGLRKRPF